MRVISWIMAAIFLGFTVVQFNDVDALIWIAAYGACALLSILRATGRAPRLGAMACGVILSVWAIILFPKTTGQWWNGEIEREVGGLAISALWCAVLALSPRNKMSRL
ncbi:MAG TPA: transmembrane 220 family protein [Candidatus Didemnitutus sp.]|nr:transmembrane 220 family protein [Candidatus Didemnitutus sp.]